MQGTRNGQRQQELTSTEAAVICPGQPESSLKRGGRCTHKQEKVCFRRGRERLQRAARDEDERAEISPAKTTARLGLLLVFWKGVSLIIRPSVRAEPYTLHDGQLLLGIDPGRSPKIFTLSFFLCQRSGSVRADRTRSTNFVFLELFHVHHSS